MKKLNKKGFTLVEMLVVIAIIAVLVAIVVPTVSTSTEKAREAADAANLRTAVSECTAAALVGKSDSASGVTVIEEATNKGTAYKGVTITQVTAGWSASDITDISGVKTSVAPLKDCDKGDTIYACVTPAGVVSFATSAPTA